MASLRPPSTSPSPSPAPAGSTPKTSSRASMGPSARPAPIIPINAAASPRTGAGRPTSELLGGAGMFQTPEAEAIDQWFENLQNYETTLEGMAAASLDVNFKEELSAIEQWFRVLSEAERTAALYSLLQHSTQLQIRFFITVLQQMARSDPMTALLSPNVQGSMQSQMEAKLAQMGLKSPGLKSPSLKPTVPASPVARSFSNSANQNRQSLAVELQSSSFLSPDSANNIQSGGNSASGINAAHDAAATLAQQRARLKANAAHRISAPPLASAGADGNRNVWPLSGSQLSQVAERSGSPGAQELVVPSPGNNNASRPKSMDFSSVASAFRSSPRAADVSGAEESQLSPMIGGNWASMVNTPLMPMFEPVQTGAGQRGLDAASAKLAGLQAANAGRISLDDARKYRRVSKVGADAASNGNGNGGSGMYDDNGNLVSANGHQNNVSQTPQRNGMNGLRSAGNANGAFFGAGGMSPGLSDGTMNAMNPGGFNVGMPSPGLGMGMAGLAAGMGQLNPLNMHMLNMANLSAMGLSPEAQLLAAQMAAANGFLPQGMSPFAALSLQQQQQVQQAANMRNNRGNRSAGAKSGTSGRDSANKDKEEDVDPSLLNDVPGWLRSLRLHKYTPNFEGISWKEMVLMDEAALEAKGVAALGARRKMLKTFEVVRNKMGIEMPN